jgi:hypothetical protein
MGILIELNLILALRGYLLPLPGLVLAWREFLKRIQTDTTKSWRRPVSQIGLSLLSCGVGLWLYGIVREALRHDYTYIVSSAGVGRWGSLSLIIICSFAEDKVRRYLLLGAAGLLFFFGASIGDVAI